MKQTASQVHNEEGKITNEIVITSMNDEKCSCSIAWISKHKVKFFLLLCASIAVILGCTFGIVVYLKSYVDKDNIARRRAAIAGTSFHKTSLIPPKGDESSRRRLLTGDPSTLPEDSAYKMAPSVQFIVDEKAFEPINTVNMIGCLLNSLRVDAIAYDIVNNPNRLPFTALVDTKLCQVHDYY